MKRKYERRRLNNLLKQLELPNYFEEEEQTIKPTRVERK